MGAFSGKKYSCRFWMKRKNGLRVPSYNGPQYPQMMPWSVFVNIICKVLKIESSQVHIFAEILNSHIWWIWHHFFVKKFWSKRENHEFSLCLKFFPKGAEEGDSGLEKGWLEGGSPPSKRRPCLAAWVDACRKNSALEWRPSGGHWWAVLSFAIVAIAHGPLLSLQSLHQLRCGKKLKRTSTKRTRVTVSAPLHAIGVPGSKDVHSHFV